MVEFVDMLVQKRRFFIAGAFIAVDLFLISVLASAAQAHHINAPKPTSSASSTPESAYDSPNLVANGFFSLVDNLDQAANTANQNISNGLASFAINITRGTKAVEHGAYVGTIAALHGVGRSCVFVGRAVVGSIVFVGRTIGSGFMIVGRFTVSSYAFEGHVFVSTFRFATHAHMPSMSSIIRPNNDESVPVISETSAAALSHLSAVQQEKITKLLAAQLTANQALGGSIVAGDPNHGGYPAKWDNAPQDSAVDSWGMYSRECVSYVAWKVYQTYGHMPYWGGVGNANQWVSDARNAGIATGSIPLVHSVAISMHGYYGHAMWVEKVEGNMIYVSQYNYDLHGHYSEMWVNGSNFTYIYFD